MLWFDRPCWEHRITFWIVANVFCSCKTRILAEREIGQNVDECKVVSVEHCDDIDKTMLFAFHQVPQVYYPLVDSTNRT